MPLSRRLSRSEVSLHVQSKLQGSGSFDGQKHDPEHCMYKRSPSKSDPPKIYVEDKPLIDVGLDGLPKIHRAVSEGNLELLKELIESGTEDVNTPDPEGWPPLYTAIKQGKLDCAAFLLKKGATDFYEKQHQEYQKRLTVSNTVAKNRANTCT